MENPKNGGFMKKIKSCSFFGHRNACLTKTQEKELKTLIEQLIIRQNVENFLFCSRSEFDQLCHEIVSQLKKKYAYIRRICYTCGSESCLLEGEREKWEQICSKLQQKQVCLFAFEEEKEHKNKITAGKASYVERNKAMVDDSNICVFFYDENYKPPEKKNSKRDVFTYQPNSGTKLAYTYAKKKKKVIYNVFN